MTSTARVRSTTEDCSSLAALLPPYFSFIFVVHAVLLHSLVTEDDADGVDGGRQHARGQALLEDAHSLRLPEPPYRLGNRLPLHLDARPDEVQRVRDHGGGAAGRHGRDALRQRARQAVRGQRQVVRVLQGRDSMDIFGAS